MNKQAVTTFFAKFGYPIDLVISNIFPFLHAYWNERREHLLLEGQVQTRIYFLMDNMGRVYYLDEQGNKVTSEFSGKIELLWVVDSFMLQIPSLENIEIYEGTCLYYMEFADFDRLLKTDPDFTQMLVNILVEQVKQGKDRERNLKKKPAKKRLAKLYKKYPDIGTYASQGEIGSKMGYTDRTVSRTKQAKKNNTGNQSI